MSAVCPELPPHLLAKRKRQQEGGEQDEHVESPDAKRQKTPPRPAAARQIGPTLPPAPLDQLPTRSPGSRSKPGDQGGESGADDDEDDNDNDDDDDFGPSLPGQRRGSDEQVRRRAVSPPLPRITSDHKPESLNKRDEWMMVPPKQDDLAARLDPSQKRPRGFNTGKSAQVAGSGTVDHDMWTETPEQKRQRLEDQVMGVKGRTAVLPAAIRHAEQHDESTRKTAKIRESRGESLYQLHQSRKDRVEDDDPSRRAFDREKDIGGSMLGDKQKRELLSKAAGFSSRFSSGSFL